MVTLGRNSVALTRSDANNMNEFCKKLKKARINQYTHNLINNNNFNI